MEPLSPGIEGKLDLIAQRLESILRKLKAPLPDRRMWEPDETCFSFLFESHTPTGNLDMGGFVIPEGRIGIINSVTTANSGGGTKPEKRIMLLRGGSPDPGGQTPQERLYAIHGALQRLTELSGTGISVAGFIAHTTPVTRPCHIVLRAQEYRIASINAVGEYFISLSGWLWTNVPQIL